MGRKGEFRIFESCRSENLSREAVADRFLVARLPPALEVERGKTYRFVLVGEP